MTKEQPDGTSPQAEEMTVEADFDIDAWDEAAYDEPDEGPRGAAGIHDKPAVLPRRCW